jgi:hypothetical protein
LGRKSERLPRCFIALSARQEERRNEQSASFDLHLTARAAAFATTIHWSASMLPSYLVRAWVSEEARAGIAPF